MKSVRTIWGSFKRISPQFVVMALGTGMIGVGLAMVYRPAGIVAVGVILVADVAWGKRQHPEDKP